MVGPELFRGQLCTVKHIVFPSIGTFAGDSSFSTNEVQCAGVNDESPNERQTRRNGMPGDGKSGEINNFAESFHSNVVGSMQLVDDKAD